MAEFTIREISEQFQLPPSTLRYYEEVGILTGVGRTAAGQRIFTDRHVNRLKTICCFKNTGMSIAQLQEFFTYEMEEPQHIDEILLLLGGQKQSIEAQLTQLRQDHLHVLRKLAYYGDIKKSLAGGQPLPEWKNYRGKTNFGEE
ncbi:MAG: MerR family transcriptional regulator [Oscillospiraceae bacterium]